MVKLGAAGQAWKNYYRYKKDLDAINNGRNCRYEWYKNVSLRME